MALLDAQAETELHIRTEVDELPAEASVPTDR
jgi:hypothetical protein